jgi:hypothetical protein
MSNAIGNPSSATQAGSAVETAPTHTASTEAVKTSAGIKQDTVKLSLAAQIKMMHHQGQSAGQIAASLGTSVASVDGYLGVKAAQQAPVASPAPAAPTESASESPAASPTATASPEAAGSSSAASEAAAPELPALKG